MVETNSNPMTIRNTPLTKNLSISNQAYLTTAMLLGTQNCNYLGQRLTNLREHITDNELVLNASVHPIVQQNVSNQTSSTLGNGAMTHSMDKDVGSGGSGATGGSGFADKTIKGEMKIRDYSHSGNNSSSSMPSSTFTIDSILASKPADMKFECSTKSDSRSPSNSPSLSTTSSPIRPTRVPAMLHPGLHLSHLAAAAATSFGTPSDFLGKWKLCTLLLFSCSPWLRVKNWQNILKNINLSNSLNIRFVISTKKSLRFAVTKYFFYRFNVITSFCPRQSRSLKIQFCFSSHCLETDLPLFLSPLRGRSLILFIYFDVTLMLLEMKVEKTESIFPLSEMIIK